jgi:aminopeptidase N
LQLSFRATPHMLPWLQRKVGVAFPFPKYYQIVAADVGGAMENISLVTWDSIFLLDPIWQREFRVYMVSCALFSCSLKRRCTRTSHDQFVFTHSHSHTHLQDTTNVHEMAHSYFGDALVCRHFEHSWLKESWATCK